MLKLAQSVAICAFVAAFLAGCQPAVEERLIGSWDAPAIDASNRITFNADHTFEGRSDGMAGVLPFRGSWRVDDGHLIMQYDGQAPISGTITSITLDEMTLEDAQGHRPFPWKRVR